MTRDDQVLSLTDEALSAILDIRGREPDADTLALSLSITGVRGVEFTYELTFIPTEDAGDDDALFTVENLPIVVKSDSIENLTGASIAVTNGGLAIDNPNSPVPKIQVGDTELDGPVADRVQQVLSEQINPAIAGHGGFAELVAVEGDTAFLRLGGGCQGCGLAQVTLSQGIEVAIIQSVPEITRVVDVTDHSSGDNPYYESSKK
ncbi:MAG TPA: NifU family protein [Acidimicrobiia bacterium]|nr:NifU family protein [Acidimicrobiia bacterium]